MNASQVAASPGLCLNFPLIGHWPVLSDGLCYPNTGDVKIPAENSTVSFTIHVPSATGSRQAIGHQTPAAISGLDLNK
ncbi:unnamed protein product [Sphagnum jensenii]